MDPQTYIEMASVEEEYFWFVARRRIISQVLDHLRPKPGSDILEIGCGTGGNLNLLARYGNIYASESDAGARKLADKRNVVKVEHGCLPNNIPFGDKSFDIIAMFDVLEHVDDDIGALRSLYKRLKSTGLFILTVPAYQFLWSHHDVVNHHKRRYLRSNLEKLLQTVGFSVIYSTYFNTIFFPIVLIVRFVNNLLRRRSGTDIKMPPRVINALLTKIFAAESRVIPQISLPYGVSILVVARKVRQRPSTEG